MQIQYELNDRIYFDDFSFIAVKTQIYGLETYAVLTLDNNNKLLDVKTCMSKEVVLTKLTCMVRAYEYSQLDSI